MNDSLDLDNIANIRDFLSLDQVTQLEASVKGLRNLNLKHYHLTGQVKLMVPIDLYEFELEVEYQTLARRLEGLATIKYQDITLGYFYFQAGQLVASYLNTQPIEELEDIELDWTREKMLAKPWSEVEMPRYYRSGQWLTLDLSHDLQVIKGQLANQPIGSFSQLDQQLAVDKLGRLEGWLSQPSNQPYYYDHSFYWQGRLNWKTYNETRVVGSVARVDDRPVVNPGGYLSYLDPLEPQQLIKLNLLDRWVLTFSPVAISSDYFQRDNQIIYYRLAVVGNQPTPLLIKGRYLTWVIGGSREQAIQLATTRSGGYDAIYLANQLLAKVDLLSLSLSLMVPLDQPVTQNYLTYQLLVELLTTLRKEAIISQTSSSPYLGSQ